MANGECADSHGNYHGADGRFVSLRDFVERIFAERETSAEFKRIALETAIVQAKSAVDDQFAMVLHRLAMLESGGAPFADRLNEGIKKMREDVDELTKDAVRTKVLDALREQTEKDALAQRKQTKYVLLASMSSLVVSLLLLVIRFFIDTSWL